MSSESDRIRLSETSDFHGVPIKWARFGSGPPLVFIPGTPWSSLLWVPIARCFAASFTVYLFDLLGYGELLPPPYDQFPPSYRLQSRLFAFLINEWREQDPSKNFRPHVVAHDIGGHVALRALLMEEGVTFASLALVDCGAAFPVDEPFFTLMRDNTAVFQSLPPALHEALARRYIRGASHRGLRPDQEDMLVRPWLSKEGQHAFYRQYQCQDNKHVAELAARYRRLDAELPLRILWARHDTWVPVERAAMLQERIGGSLKVIEDAGHLVQLDAPEALTFELTQWLNGVGGVKAATVMGVGETQ